MLRFPGFLRFRPGSRRRSRLPGMPGCVQLLEQRVLPAFNLVIGTGLTSGVTESTPGHFEASASGAFLSVADIQNRMAAGHDVSITSGENGQEAGSITWNAGAELDFNGTGTRQLTIRSHDSSQTGNVLFTGRVRDSVPGDDDLSVTLVATRGLTIESGASITTADGGILLRGNAGIRRQAGSFHGVLVRGSLTTTGSGEIVIEGRSGLSRNSGRQGVLLSYASVTSSGSGDIRISGMADLMPIRIQASQLTSSGTGDVALSGDDIAISSNSTIDVGDNAASFAPLTSGISIVLGGTSETVDNLDLQAGELNRITAGLVRVGHLSDAGSAEMGIRTWDITIPRAYVAPAGWNTLSLIGRGLISQAGPLTVANVAASSWDGVHLPLIRNSVGQIAGRTKSSNFTFMNSGTRTLTVGTVDGLTGIESAGGDVYVRAASGLTLDAEVDSGSGTGGVATVGANVTQNVTPVVGDGDVRLNAGAIPVARTDKLQFDDIFITQSFVIDPINNFFDETVITFDNRAQIQRVDITFNNPNETPLRITIILMPQEGVSFRINNLPDGTTNVIMGSYTIALSPLRFDPSTPGQLVDVAGQLLEQYDFQTELTLDTYLLRPSPAGSRFRIPVSIHSRSLTSPATLSTYLQYFNYSTFTNRIDTSTLAIGNSPDVAGFGLRFGFPVSDLQVLEWVPGRQRLVGQPVTLEFGSWGHAASFDLLLSRDGGQTYATTLASGVTRDNGVSSLTFTPDAAHRTTQGRLRLVARYADGSTLTADTPGTFVIR